MEGPGELAESRAPASPPASGQCGSAGLSLLPPLSPPPSYLLPLPSSLNVEVMGSHSPGTEPAHCPWSSEADPAAV